MQEQIMTEPTRPHNPARRSLARGALATPVVLASLTAKNALAGNYACTTSGKMSGNTSHAHAQDSCRDVGWSCQQWKSSCKGNTTKVADCIGLDYKGRSEKVGNQTKLKRANYTRPLPRSSKSGDWTSGTVDHLLNGEDDQDYPLADRDLVLAGVCAYLNAQKFRRSYYISEEDARGLFLGAVGKQTFVKNGKSWPDADCRDLLMTLYF